MADVVFRPARRDESRTIAQLYAISSDGVAQYTWSTLAQPGEELLDVGARRYAREGTVFSYQSCTMAEVDGEVVGMLVAFPMHVDPHAEPSGDPVLAPYEKLEEDASYYICGIAFFEAHRGKGYGRRLMALAEQQVRARGLTKLSLIVFEDNQGAVRLYRRLGYREVMREAVVPHPLIHFTGDALLMVKTLPA